MTEPIYQDKPNIVHIVFKDASGEAERYVVGKTLDEVLTQYGLSLYVPGPTKAKRTRRTKAAMEEQRARIADEPTPEQPEGVPEPHTPLSQDRPRKEKAWA